MGFLRNIFSKAAPPMKGTVNRVEKDEAGNIWYVSSMLGNMRKWRTDYDMTNTTDKALALVACEPFYMVVDKVGSMMSRGIPYVVDKNGNEKRTFKNVRDLLMNPNPLQTFSVFLKQIEVSLKVFGYCPVSIVRGYAGAEVRAMWVIPPELFHMVATGKVFREFGEDDVISKKYISWVTGDIVLENYECLVLHNGTMRIEGKGVDVKFESVSDSLSVPISNWIASMSASHTLLVNGGPKGIVYNDYMDEMENHGLTKSEEDEIKDEFKRRYGLVNKDYPILVTRKKLGWIPLDFNADQLKLHENEERCTTKICNAMGINPNLFSDAKYDNQESAKKAAYQDVVIPDSQIIAEGLTKALCPEGAFVKIDFSSVECLQLSKDSEASTLVKVADAMERLLGKNLITPEEARMEISKYIDIDPNRPKGELGRETEETADEATSENGKEEEDEEQV